MYLLLVIRLLSLERMQVYLSGYLLELKHPYDHRLTPSKNVSAGTFADYLEAQWPEVDKDTAISRWAGERMDFDMAVEGLMH
jgi:hypothetical protein